MTDQKDKSRLQDDEKAYLEPNPPMFASEGIVNTMDRPAAARRVDMFTDSHYVNQSGALKPPVEPSISSTLQERGDRYGDFEDHARIADSLIRVMENHVNTRGVKAWDSLPPYMRQSLRVDADKIARILNGDPFYVDNWHDKQGYAALVEKIITRNGEGR
jgi:hypothetical protein